MPDTANERQYGPQYKLIGKNYTTADLLAKVNKLPSVKQAKVLHF